MKGPGILLASLALNLILAAAVVGLRGQRSASPPIQVITVNQRASERLVDEAQQLATNPPTSVLPPTKFHWGFVESADYRQYIANLRAINCPGRLIRDVIIADVGKLYAGKMQEMNSARDGWQPWYGNDRRRAAYRERSGRIRALQAEQRALIKELLGIEWNEPWNGWHQDGAYALLLGFLPEPKPAQIVAMIEEFSDGNRTVHDKVGGILLEEDHEQLTRLRQGVMNKLNSMMTPAEFEELSLRAQGMGKFLEGEIHLEGVSLSGAEFRQLCGLSRITGDVLQDEFLRDRNELSDEEEERRQKAFEAEVKKLLGPARFGDYQRAQQPEFRDALGFTEEHHLPLGAAVKVSDAIRNASKQADVIKQNRALSSDEQIAALTVLKSVTVNALSSALGSKYAKYAEDKGTGLDSLFERPLDSTEESP